MVVAVAGGLLGKIIGRLFPKGLSMFDRTVKSTGSGAGAGLGLGLGIGAGSAIGAGLGGSAVTIAMVPFNAVNNYLGSFYFGAGMILGERWMYQEVWPKIQERVKDGESFMVLVEPYIIQAQSMLMKNAEIIGKDIATAMSTGSLSFLSELLSGDIEGAFDLPDVPPDVPKPPQPKSDKEKRKSNTETLDNALDEIPNATWESIVGPRKTRKDVIASIKYIQLLIDQTWRDIKTQRLSNTNKPKNLASKLKFIKVQEIVKNHYKNALSWLNKNYPAKTP